MATRPVNLVVDSAQPRELAGFWAELLGWRIALDLPSEVAVRAPAADGWDLDLVMVPVPEAKTAKNRIHLDLASGSAAEQRALVDRAVRLGAEPVDIGQGPVPWVVLADPEGNEFCVLEPRPEYARTGAVAAIVLDAADPAGLAAFWAGATGWVLSRRADAQVGLRAPTGRGPWLELLGGAEPKRGKNRVHLDVAPPAGGGHAGEVERLVRLGARTADVGQRDEPWRVLADPEGNEFCVLTPR
ncbi:VOC family protein [Amycolatopsis nigrescens]|uniref:VOC family protein n=1 Tax=Amycolatopsis nigrescens TaxID=381445 RepID=UPI000475FAA1|nr:VOC family protein [Amycolatopsis nigrescens]